MEPLQKPDLFIEHSPFRQRLEQEANETWNQIRENLSRTIQMGEWEPGFAFWTKELNVFINNFGFYFTKTDHIKLVKVYLSVLSNPNLNLSLMKLSCEILYDLLRKTRLINRDELTIDWRIFYRWIQLLDNHRDVENSLVVAPKYSFATLSICVRKCCHYFSVTATQEILDELRPKIYPLTFDFNKVTKAFQLLLPVTLPPQYHDQGFKLWLSEFFNLWVNVYSDTCLEQNLVEKFATVAWHNIGYIDWEPWMAQIFTRFLRGFSLPIGKKGDIAQRYSYYSSDSAQWIVAMLGNRSSCLQYLRDLLMAIKSFYQPINSGVFQLALIEFLECLGKNFVERLHLERKANPDWFFKPVQSHRLTENDIDDFVDCLKDYVFLAIFGDYSRKANRACQYLSMLRPQFIVPYVIDQTLSSAISALQYDHFMAILKCVTQLAPQIVRQTVDYTENQLYVLPLLMSLLPGIDMNDFRKLLSTLDFYEIMLSLITIVDCSSALKTRYDLTEIEKQVCLTTKNFETFIDEFFNQIFRMIERSHFVLTDSNVSHTDDTVFDLTIKSKLARIISIMSQQSSDKLYQVIQKKILQFIDSGWSSPTASELACTVVAGIVGGRPALALEHLLPKTCQMIGILVPQTENNQSYTESQDKTNDENMELLWHLSLFTQLLQTDGTLLLPYKNFIISTFQKCIKIDREKVYNLVSLSARNLICSLSHVFPTDLRWMTENIEEPFVDCLPIRTWGKYIRLEDVQAKFHIPNMQELEFVFEFINLFYYPELDRLKQNVSTMSKNERSRSLGLVNSIVESCFRIVPTISSQKKDLNGPSCVPRQLKDRPDLLAGVIHSGFTEQIRIRLMVDMEQVLDSLTSATTNDSSSINTAIQCYASVPNFSLPTRSTYNITKKIDFYMPIVANRVYGEPKLSRPVIICKIINKFLILEQSRFKELTHIAEKVISKIFDMSINRYGKVRSVAQNYLFDLLTHYPHSYQLIVDRLVKLLENIDTAANHEVEGCLHILLGNRTFFLPMQKSWAMREKLWPLISALSLTKHMKTLKLIEDIHKKMKDEFFTTNIIDSVDQSSIDAAVALWQPLDSFEQQTLTELNASNTRSYENLMISLNSLLKSSSTSIKTKMTMGRLSQLLQKQVPIPVTCIKTFLDFLTDHDIEVRQYAAKCVNAICHLQKPPRIAVKKSLAELFESMKIPIPEPSNNNQINSERIDNAWLTIDGYEIPKTQDEWEQSCFLDKSYYGYYAWPKMIQYFLNKRDRYSQENMSEGVAIIYERFTNKEFLKNLSEIMIPIKNDEIWKVFDLYFPIFKGISRNFGSLVVEHFIAQVQSLTTDPSNATDANKSLAAAIIVAGLIRGSKYWTLTMLNELWEKLTPVLNHIIAHLSSDTRCAWFTCFRFSLTNADPRRMHHLIRYLAAMINQKKSDVLSKEVSRWYQIRALKFIHWRIPSIWHQFVQKDIGDLLNESYRFLRDLRAEVMTISVRFDNMWNSQTYKRSPDTDMFFDLICEKLQQEIKRYRENYMDNDSTESQQQDNPINFIKGVIGLYSDHFQFCEQPVRRTTIRLFGLLCRLEDIAADADGFKNDLASARLKIGLVYLNEPFVGDLIRTLIDVYNTAEWRARQEVLKFFQTMVFSNFFNARIYSQELHDVILASLIDEQREVRETASTTLAGFYQCGCLKISQKDFHYFQELSELQYRTSVAGKKIYDTKKLVKRHGGVLGLCAIILSSPYDILPLVSDSLKLFDRHLEDPSIIQTSIKQCLSKFQLTHRDSWHEHRKKLNEYGIDAVGDSFVLQQYYA